MTIALAAIYEQGVLRPLQPVELSEGAMVEVILISQKAAPDGPVAAKLLAEIAALPDEGLPDPFSGQDHDQVLYPEPKDGQ